MAKINRAAIKKYNGLCFFFATFHSKRITCWLNRKVRNTFIEYVRHTPIQTGVQTLIERSATFVAATAYRFAESQHIGRN